MSREILATGLSVVALAALAVVSLTPASPRAEIVDPTVAATIGVAKGSAAWPSDRGGPARNGRVSMLPVAPKLRWQKGIGARIEAPPVVDDKGNVLLVAVPTGASGSDGTLIELAASTGEPKTSVKLRTPQSSVDPSIAEGIAPLQQDVAAAPPIVLASGVRVVLTVRGFAIGVGSDGNVLFRTRLASELASAPRGAAVPLPNGGFAVARKPELIELDGNGHLVDRVKLEVAPHLAVRENGEVLAVTPQGDLVAWRAGKVPRTLGTFGEKTAWSATGPCVGGLALDGTSSGAKGARRERAICVTESMMEQIDLATGTRKALTARLVIPFRTGPAIGTAGEIVAVLAGGILGGLGPLGTDLGPYDIPGAAPLPLTKDGGLSYALALGETAPIVADDGTIAWGSSDGVALVRPGAQPVKLMRCQGSATTTLAGLASVGPGTLLVACSDGRVELWADGPITKG